jgi:hypothetical protein
MVIRFNLRHLTFAMVLLAIVFGSFVTLWHSVICNARYSTVLPRHQGDDVFAVYIFGQKRQLIGIILGKSKDFNRVEVLPCFSGEGVSIYVDDRKLHFNTMGKLRLVFLEESFSRICIVERGALRPNLLGDEILSYPEDVWDQRNSY